MEEFITADQVQLGDIIKCICEQGCIKADQCPSHCITNNPCNTTPQGTWEKVNQIQYQPATNDVWIYFGLTHNKEFGTWAKSLIIRYKP